MHVQIQCGPVPVFYSGMLCCLAESHGTVGQVQVSQVKKQLLLLLLTFLLLNWISSTSVTSKTYIVAKLQYVELKNTEY